jgi:3,4-dihydroxy 2-butanone 4-phosphate synthase/GTP cyclohydrolase II
MKLAGLAPAGVICEIMNDDGTMARLPELAKFRKQHHLKWCTVADLIDDYMPLPPSSTRWSMSR